jgi:hypothetical protein
LLAPATAVQLKVTAKNPVVHVKLGEGATTKAARVEPVTETLSVRLHTG